MPYSGKDDPDLPSNVKKMGDHDRTVWVSTFNSVYKGCVDDGGKTGDCESKAFSIANGNAKKEESVISRFVDFVKGLFSQERSLVSFPDIYAQVAGMVAEKYPDVWYWLIDVYMESKDGNMYSVFASEGKLYKAQVDFKVDPPTMGEMKEVMIDYPEKIANSISICRQADERTRWFILTGTSVLNRSGRIDARSLFDSMNSRCKETGEYPFLTFFHRGMDFKMGIADWLGRDGNVALASGLFDQDSDLAKAFIESAAKNPDYWGASNQFWITAPPEELSTSEGIVIPVYTKGSYVEISILPEKMACSLFTSTNVIRSGNMDKNIEEALKVLTGEDEELYKQLAEKIDLTNRTIAEKGLISRSEEPPCEKCKGPDEEEDKETEEEANDDVEEVTLPELQAMFATKEEVETTKSLVLTEILRATGEVSTIATSNSASVQTLVDQITKLSIANGNLEARLNDLSKKVDAEITFIKEEKEKLVKESLEDLPRNYSANSTSVRPREDEGKRMEKVSSSVIADESVSKIK
jgi:hypothetical protein